MSQRNRITHLRQGKANVRLLILVGLLLLVGAAFMYDKYSLMPSATEKINKVLNDVTMSLNEGNRKAVEEIVGIQPSNTFQHGNLEVVQYRFPRGLPFYPRPILDIAYDGDAIAFAKPEELTPELLDQLKPTNMVGELDRENRDETKIVGVGGGGRNRGSSASANNDEEPADKKTSGDETPDEDKSDEGNSDDDQASENESGDDNNSDSEDDG